MSLEKTIVPLLVAIIVSVGLIAAAGNISIGGSSGAVGVPGVNLFPQTAEINVVNPDGNHTLTQNESGSIVYATTTAATSTLPAVRDGLVYTFVIDEAITGDWIIDSAEGDNINGTLSVNNADVACSGEDQLTFVSDGETIGDYVTLIGDGSGWIIHGSEVETAAKLTCTDPN